MSLLSWMFPAKKAAKPTTVTPESSGLSRMEPTRPAARGSREIVPGSNAQPANRKQARMARRELLYSVVREAMMRAGILSASYKFKVLSLDGHGRQFLVMVDLARDCEADTPQLAEVEAAIAQAAKVRHDILVSAVYWRMSEHVAVGEPKAQSQRAEAMTDSQPIPLDSEPAPLVTKPAARPRFEPIGTDEVAAFKRALAAGAQAAPAGAAATGAGAASAPAFDGKSHHGPQSYTLLTGFEDTEVADSEARTPVLSGTQYGSLN